MKKKVLINGLGRIGRAILRINIECNAFDLVAINDINPDNRNIAYLIKYDTTYGRIENDIIADKNNIYIDGKKIRITHMENVSELDTGDIDIVIESTGIKRNIIQIEEMIKKNVGVCKYIITNIDSKMAPNVIFGVNHEILNDRNLRLVSSSICDAVSMGPVYDVVNSKYTVVSGFLTTLHPWLSYQNLLDGPAKSWSQPGDVYSHYALGRASVMSLIPKSTSAISAVANVFPEVRDKICSFSYRVPTPVVSSAVLTLCVKENVNISDLVEAFEIAEEKQQYSIIQTTDEPLISVDYAQNYFSAIIDKRWIKTSDDHHLEIVYWYDNEWGYSSRIVDIVKYWGDLV